jgi:hypothetical protein
MDRRWRRGATAAAVLPSALAAALLVSAPFAGTTTAPLADSHTQSQAQPVKAGPAQAGGSTFGSGISLDIPTTSVLTLLGAETLLVGVGAGVIVVARRRRHDEV